MIKNAKLVELNTKTANGTSLKDNLIEYKYLCLCNENYKKKLHENLKKFFFNKYKFSVFYSLYQFFHYPLSKRCLPLWMYRWLGEIQWNIITWQIRFYSHLNMEDIGVAD